jgi:hemerythrin
MFDWKDEYSVRIRSIDTQHQTLFRLAGELHAAMLARQVNGSLAKILDRLVQYTAMHFAHEERLMSVNNYPDLQAHKAEHEALTGQVLKFQSDFRTGRVAMTIQLFVFLKDWLEKHIKGTDKKYMPFIVEGREKRAS